MTARAARRRVVEVVSEFLRNHAAEGVRIAEASRAVGVSERTLRNAFHHEHGISPKQFDLRERLRAARRALCEGSTRTVTEIATEFGFFELGRFSRIYRRRVWRAAVADHQSERSHDAAGIVSTTAAARGSADDHDEDPGINGGRPCREPPEHETFQPLSASFALEVAAASFGGKWPPHNTDHYLAVRAGRMQETIATSLGDG